MTDIVKYKPKRSDNSNSPTARGLYAQYLFTKRTTRANGKPCTPRRDLTLAFPKTHVDPFQCTNYKFLSDHCMQAVSREPQWSGAWPAGGVWPIKDGDVPYVAKPKPGVTPLTAEQIEEKYGWRKGHWIIEVTNFLEPGPKISVLRNGQIEDVPAQVMNGIETFKSGDFCIVNLCSYTYWNEQLGCNYGFDGVCWVGEGKRVGGGNFAPKSTEQMFGGIAPVLNQAAGPPIPGPQPGPVAQAYAPSPPTAPLPPATHAPAPPGPPSPPAAHGLPPLPPAPPAPPRPPSPPGV